MPAVLSQCTNQLLLSKTSSDNSCDNLPAHSAHVLDLQAPSTLVLLVLLVLAPLLAVVGVLLPL
jgi:hypothetical protein